jgi:hypothetical protein
MALKSSLSLPMPQGWLGQRSDRFPANLRKSADEIKGKLGEANEE